MTTSQNGWPVLEAEQLRRWLIPASREGDHIKYLALNRSVVLPLARGAAGFLLVHFALWFHEECERLNVQRQPDDWGWANRDIRGPSTDISNHASGTAMDLNATEHPRGVPTRDTFSASQVQGIHRRLQLYRGCLRWGGDYKVTPDAMHVEIDADHERVQRRATELRDSPRGLRVWSLNPPHGD